jgi:hypothetical protein
MKLAAINNTSLLLLLAKYSLACTGKEEISVVNAMQSDRFAVCISLDHLD